jgi:hypothetical protein
MANNRTAKITEQRKTERRKSPNGEIYRMTKTTERRINEWRKLQNSEALDIENC